MHESSQSSPDEPLTVVGRGAGGQALGGCSEVEVMWAEASEGAIACVATRADLAGIRGSGLARIHCRQAW